MLALQCSEPSWHYFPSLDERIPALQRDVDAPLELPIPSLYLHSVVSGTRCGQYLPTRAVAAAGNNQQRFSATYDQYDALAFRIGDSGVAV